MSVVQTPPPGSEHHSSTGASSIDETAVIPRPRSERDLEKLSSRNDQTHIMPFRFSYSAYSVLAG